MGLWCLSPVCLTSFFFFGKQCSVSQLIVLRRPAHHTMVTHNPRLGVRGQALKGLQLWNNALSVDGCT